MVNRDDAEPKYFSDEEAEQLFGLSHSKLRTAQRFGLAESASALHQGRYVRMWSDVDLTKAGCAAVMADALAVPFAACCCILTVFYQLRPEATRIHEYAARNTQVAPMDLRKFWTRDSVIASANRKVIFLMTGDRIEVLGRLESGPDGRHVFVRDHEEEIPSVDQSYAWCAFNPVSTTAKMVALIDTA